MHGPPSQHLLRAGEPRWSMMVQLNTYGPVLLETI